MSSRRKSQTMAAVLPTPERARHGQVELLPQTIADEGGNVARPHRSIDILAAMERRGAITPQMRDAGEDFRRQFRLAHLDPLCAVDMLRIRSGGHGCPTEFAENARRQVWQTIEALGGIHSPAGSCLWHVVGLEESLKQWALERGGHCSQEVAGGVLRAALGVIAR